MLLCVEVEDGQVRITRGSDSPIVFTLSEFAAIANVVRVESLLLVPPEIPDVGDPRCRT